MSKTTSILLILCLLSASCSMNTSKKTCEALVKIGTTSIKVAVARTPDEKSDGLSGRVGESMLFDFRNDTERRPSFWMKDMLYNLDAAWIANGKIVKLEKNIPKPATPDEEPVHFYPPDMDIDYVLEVPAGDAHELGLNTFKDVTVTFENCE